MISHNAFLNIFPIVLLKYFFSFHMISISFSCKSLKISISFISFIGRNIDLFCNVIHAPLCGSFLCSIYLFISIVNLCESFSTNLKSQSFANFMSVPLCIIFAYGNVFLICFHFVIFMCPFSLLRFIYGISCSKQCFVNAAMSFQ